MRASLNRTLPALLAAIVAATCLAGCDKCGQPIKLVAPSVNSCGGNADPDRG